MSNEITLTPDEAKRILNYAESGWLAQYAEAMRMLGAVRAKEMMTPDLVMMRGKLKVPQ
jgi:hypothetical protein